LLVLLGTLLLLLPIWRPRQFGLLPESAPAIVQLPDHDKLLTERIAQFYDLHYMEGVLDLEGAAKGIGLHPRKLQLVLRERFQTTHTAKVGELRMREAARLLRESANPVGEIALSVGYNTVSHFNRTFKERYGVSPMEYREGDGSDSPPSA
jgi:AraC-like DNA-binding protein